MTGVCGKASRAIAKPVALPLVSIDSYDRGGLCFADKIVIMLCTTKPTRFPPQPTMPTGTLALKRHCVVAYGTAWGFSHGQKTIGSLFWCYRQVGSKKEQSLEQSDSLRCEYSTRTPFQKIKRLSLCGQKYSTPLQYVCHGHIIISAPKMFATGIISS